MHELSVVQNIINIVSLAVERNGGGRVSEVSLEIGKLSGVEFGSLDFALTHLKPGSIIESAEILVDKPEGVARCRECLNEFELNDPIGCCDTCNSFNLEIIKGRELIVKSITIE